METESHMPDLYNIGSSPQELQSGLKRLRADFDAHIHDGSSSRSFQTLIVETVSARTILIRKTSYSDTQAGIWMGFQSGVMKLALGSSTSSMTWDGSNFAITGGTITGGTIRTAVSGARLQIDGNYLRIINASEVTIGSIVGAAAGQIAIFNVNLSSYAAANVNTGFIAITQKGSALNGNSTGGTAYSVSASSSSYSASFSTSDSDGYATGYFQSSSITYAALEVNGGTWMDGGLYVDRDVVLGSDIGINGGGLVNGNWNINGDSQVAGDFTVGGTKAGIIDTKSFGRLTFVATEAPTAYFTDCGESALSGKKATIIIDPKLRESIEDDSSYLVFISPTIDIGSFHVAREKGRFTVIGEHDGGFMWELKALRKGYNKFRYGYLDGFESDYVVMDPGSGLPMKITRRIRIDSNNSITERLKNGKPFVPESSIKSKQSTPMSSKVQDN